MSPETIDIGGLETDDTRALDRVAAEIEGPSRSLGMFHIVGHGLADGDLARFEAAMRALFALPDPVKQQMRRSRDNAWGYFDEELTKNRPDWKEIFDVGPAEAGGPLAGARPQWPELNGFRKVMTAFARACHAEAQRLLGAIATNLGMPPQHLCAAFGADHTSFLRLNYYPTCANPAPPDSPTVPPEGALGIGHHTDAGALTVLLPDRVPGLQVLKDERWHTVRPLRHALIINIGDIVQVWSNDRYRAPVHRVIANTTQPRYSAPYFFNPSYATDYAPLPSVLARGEHAG